MVNSKQAVNKLPSLLVHSKTTSKRGHNEYKRLERDLQRLKRKSPEEFSNLVNQYVSAVQKIESAINSKNF